jgi:hypothetical protein
VILPSIKVKNVIIYEVRGGDEKTKPFWLPTRPPEELVRNIYNLTLNEVFSTPEKAKSPWYEGIRKTFYCITDFVFHDMLRTKPDYIQVEVRYPRFTKREFENLIKILLNEKIDGVTL